MKNCWILRSNRFLLFAILFVFESTLGQDIEEGYYMFPVRPGQENYLSGTMGELRSTHFHTALDIKTSGITGLPIYAAAAGYIQRVKVSIGGYGNALYVKHPNGTTTVYAHLLEFQGAIGEYVRQEQYKRESFEVDLHPAKGVYRVGKGDVIALSGNSGSSSGPHLHFEIRDENQKVMDPLKHGFKEIVDNLPPILQQVAFVTMDKESTVNGMFGRFEFNVVDEDGEMRLEEPVTLFGNIGVEVYAYDKFNGARNRNGIVNQTLLFDYKPVFNQNISKLSFSKARNILVHMNYKRMKEGGRRFNKYYISDGNLLKFYNSNELGGVLHIVDPFEHSLDIRLEDSYGNASQYSFKLNDEGFSKKTSYKNMYQHNQDSFDIIENTLEIMAEADSIECFAEFYVDGDEHLVAYSYKAEKSQFYLWSLSSGLPDSARVCDRSYVFDFKEAIPPRNKMSLYEDDFELDLPKYGLFDTLYLRYSKSYNIDEYQEYFNFMNVTDPLRQSATITLIPELEYDTSKSGVYSINGKGQLSYAGGEWVGGNIQFKTRDLVKYTIATDTIPPEIKKIKSAKDRLRFKIEDETSGILSFRAELDSKWILMNYDGKSGIIWSDPKINITGNFELSVTDNMGNESKFQANY